MASGAPSLSHSTGAALLPVFATRDGDGRFCVKIGAPLSTDFRDKIDAIRAATAGFLTVLESAVLESPGQWRGWKYLKFDGTR